MKIFTDPVHHKRRSQGIKMFQRRIEYAVDVVACSFFSSVRGKSLFLASHK